MPSQFQLQKAFASVSTHLVSSGSILRILIVWLICLVSLRIDNLNDFDFRFQMRGDRSPAKDIVIIELTPSDLRHFNSTEVQDLMLLNSSSDINDNYYWNPHLWNSLLVELLKQQPKTIIITLDLVKQALTDTLNVGLLSNPKVTWVYSSDMDPLGLEKKRLLDVLNIQFEKDGVVRRVLSPARGEPARYINFQGAESRYFKVTYNQLINNEWPLDFFKDKIIVIGGFTNSDYEYITPMGSYGRSALVAQLIQISFSIDQGVVILATVIGYLCFNLFNLFFDIISTEEFINYGNYCRSISSIDRKYLPIRHPPLLVSHGDYRALCVFGLANRLYGFS